MPRRLLALFLTVVSAQPLIAQTTAPIVPGVLTNPLTGARSSTSLQIERYQSQVYTNGAWQDENRVLLSHYAGPNQPGRLQFEWLTAGSWQPVQQQRVQYTAAGLTATDTTLRFDAGLPAPQPFSAAAHTYNSAGQRTQWLISGKDAAGWRPTMRYTYSYNAGGQNTDYLTEIGTSTGLQPFNRTLMTYNAQGLLTVRETQRTLDQGATWEPETQQLYTLDALGRPAQVIQQSSPGGGPYQNDSRVTYQYAPTGPGYPLSQRIETWAGGAWQPSKLFSFTYDAQNNLLEQLEQTWDGTGFRNERRTQVFYQLVNRARVAAGALPLRVVPNPTSAAAALHIELPAAAPTARVEVLDALGRAVAAVPLPAGLPAGAHTVALPTATLPAGLYVVRLQAGGQVAQTRLLVQ